MYNQGQHAIVFMEVLSMNEALKTQLKILKLSDIKPNFSELARFYDLDRRTVKKYYDGYEGKAAHRDKPSKLDKHYDLIKQKLSIRGANVRAVYEFILSERDPNIGTYSNFNKYIKSKGLKPVKTVAGHPRFETAPGIQAQVDWKEDVSIANRFTSSIKTYSYPRSRSLPKSRFIAAMVSLPFALMYADFADCDGVIPKTA